MPNRHGDLDIVEAAEYLGVSVSRMQELAELPCGPSFYPSKEEAHIFKEGPWFPRWALDAIRPMADTLVMAGRLTRTGVTGPPKSKTLREILADGGTLTT